MRSPECRLPRRNRQELQFVRLGRERREKMTLTWAELFHICAILTGVESVGVNADTVCRDVQSRHNLLLLAARSRDIKGNLLGGFVVLDIDVVHLDGRVGIAIRKARCFQGLRSHSAPRQGRGSYYCAQYCCSRHNRNSVVFFVSLGDVPEGAAFSKQELFVYNPIRVVRFLLLQTTIRVLFPNPVAFALFRTESFPSLGVSECR